MKFKPSTVDDIRRYYEKTFCKVVEHGDKLFFLEQVASNHEGWEVRLKDSDNELYSILLEENAPYEMNFALPHRALFNYRNTVCLLERIPARQYKRGINQDNTRIVEVFNNKVQALDFRRLEAFVKKMSYCSVNEALFAKRGAGVVGVALSSRISFYTPAQSFYVDMVPFAQYIRAENIIVPIAENAYRLFAPELKQLVDLSHPTQPMFN